MIITDQLELNAFFEPINLSSRLTSLVINQTET